MRLLNIENLKLESFTSSKSAPSYAILSHVWEEEEVIFSDIQEQAYYKDYQDLQQRLEDLQLCFDDLQSRFEDLQSQFNKPSQGAFFEGEETLAPRQHSYPRSNERLETENEPDDTYLRLAKSKKGWSKIEGCCREAKFGINYIWIDTCCIDKDSSTELSETINSMFNWYMDSKICFAYLCDASDINDAFGVDSPTHCQLQTLKQSMALAWPAYVCRRMPDPHIINLETK